MTDKKSQPDRSLALETAQLIEPICDEFEQAWSAGKRPVLQEFLHKVKPSARKSLLRQLVPLELEFRSEVGETAQVEDYLPALGELEAVLVEVFAEFNRGGNARSSVPRNQDETCDWSDQSATDTPGSELHTPLTDPNEPVPRRIHRKPTRRFGEYELLEEVARGGMGVVYKARHVKLQRLCALKMILAGHLASSETVDRFYEEAKAAAGLQHSNIVPVFEVGQHDGQHFFAMAYIEGTTLAQMTAENPLSPPLAAQLVEEIATAVDYAHTHDILHRDIKPGNVLVDTEGHVHVTDFGLAKRVDDNSELTSTGQVLGTPSYMPPEQALGETDRIGPHSDVYSVGAVLYALLTGRPPFQADTVTNTLLQVIYDEPARPRLLSPAVPQDLETITLKCLEKEPKKRYGSAKELADELGRFQRGEPIQARPVSQLERAWRWCKRNPTVATVGALAVLFLLVGSVVSTTLAVVADRNAKQYRAQRDENEVVLQKLRAERRQTRRHVYGANMKLAHELWKTNDLRQMRSAIEQFTPQSDQLSKEGELWKTFEWRYLYRLSHADRAWLAHGGAAIRILARAPDGRTVATVADDRQIMIWDLLEGKRLAVLAAPSGPIRAVAFFGDGKIVVGALAAGQICSWNVADRRLLETYAATQKQIAIAAATPDGKRFAWVERRSVQPAADLPLPPADIVVWDRVSATVLSKFAIGQEAIEWISLSASGKILTVGLGLKPLRIWDIERHAELESLPTNNPVTAAVFSSDDQQLALGTNIGEILVVDIASRDPTLRIAGHQGAVTSLTYSPDDQVLLSSGTDRALRAWELARGIRAREYRGNTDHITASAFASDGGLIVSASRDGYIRCWDRGVMQDFVPATGFVTPAGPVAHTADGATLAVVCRDRQVALYDTETWRVRTTLVGHHDAINDVAFSPTGELVATCANDGGIRIYKTGDGAHVNTLIGHSGPVNCLAFSADGKVLASGGKDKSFRIWFLEEERDTVSVQHLKAEVTALAFSPDKNRQILVAGDRTGMALVWDVSNNGAIVEPFDCQQGEVHAVTFNSQGDRFAVAAATGLVRIFDAVNGSPAAILGKRGYPVFDLAFSPDGTMLATVGAEILLWDAKTTVLTFEISGTHKKAALGLSFSPDGKQLVTCGQEGGICLWGVPSTEQFLSGIKAAELARPLRLPPRPIRQIAFSPDGHNVATVSDFVASRTRSHGSGGFLRFMKIDSACLKENFDCLRFWNAATGAETTRVAGAEFGVESVAYGSEPARFAVGNRNGSIWIYDSDTKKRIGQFFVDPRADAYWTTILIPIATGIVPGVNLQYAIKHLAFVRHGKWLVSHHQGDEGGELRVWNLDDLDSIREPLAVLSSGRAIRAIAVDNSGERIAALFADRVRIWDLGGETISEPTDVSLSDDAELISIALSPSGELLAMGSRDRYIRLWDIKEQKIVTSLLGHRAAVQTLAFSPDGATLASGAADGDIRLWSTSTYVELAGLNGHEGPVHAAAFSPDGQYLATGGESSEGVGQLLLWPAGQSEKILSEKPGK